MKIKMSYSKGVNARGQQRSGGAQRPPGSGCAPVWPAILGTAAAHEPVRGESDIFLIGVKSVLFPPPDGFPFEWLRRSTENYLN